MRDLDYQSRIQVRSIPEIIEAIETYLARHGSSRKTTFRDRKLTSEALVNAAVIRFLEMDRQRQEHEIAEAVRKLESLLEFDEPSDATRELLLSRPVADAGDGIRQGGEPTIGHAQSVDPPTGLPVKRARKGRVPRTGTA